jgi:hypothetical protein
MGTIFNSTCTRYVIVAAFQRHVGPQILQLSSEQQSEVCTMFQKIAKQMLLATALQSCKQSTDVNAMIRVYRRDQTNCAFSRASKPDLCIFFLQI